MRTLNSALCWALYSICSLLLSVWLAWYALAQLNFLYPVWYSALSIDQTVSESAPRNQYKKNFSETTTKEHYRLFAEIVSAVQSNGRGLAEIRYFDREGALLGNLLTKEEVIHLRDVAHLVSTLNWVSLVLVIISLLAIGIIFLFRFAMPAIRAFFIYAGAIVLAALALLQGLGPTRIFYWLHTIVFPEGHQWFFYYEESLMSMLMKAPALFVPIGAQLLLLGLLIWGFQLVLIKKTGLFRKA